MTSGVIRTPSMIGLPPPEPRASEFWSRFTGVGGGVPPKPRLATRPLFVCCWLLALAKPLGCDELPAADNRSMLEFVVEPDPGANSFDDVSAAPELPTNMSFSTRAIWRASPYLTR